MTDLTDPLALSQALIRCASVTPEDAGAQQLLGRWLQEIGFTVEHLRFEETGTPAVDNLFARFGHGSPHLAFAGHTDVVPPGPIEQWRADPFSATIEDGELIGRGAADMKTGITCFIAALARSLEKGPLPGSVSLLITGDEEGPAINGTAKLIEWASRNGHRPDACLVGEPTCPEILGDVIKIGRRGSLTCRIDVGGTQGHVAYPDRADNAAHRLVQFLKRIVDDKLDDGNAHFPPSTLQITTIDIGNPATNVVPGLASANLNIRYNTEHTHEELEARLSAHAQAIGGPIKLSFLDSAHPFMTEPGNLTGHLTGAIEELTGLTPKLSTTGGTSDARFICHYCPVVEFGIVGKTMHAIDERVQTTDIEGLTQIYHRFLERFLAA